MSELQTVNPFAEVVDTKNLSAGVVASQAREEMELKAMFAVAHSVGRDMRQAWNDMMAAVERPGFCSHPDGRPRALYIFKKGQEIKGLSVYTAREMMRCWGGLAVDSPRIVAVTDEEVHIRAVAIDLLTVNRHAMEAQFRKLVQTKAGWVSPDERDLQSLVLRNAAKLERNVILKHIPQDIQDTMTAKILGQMRLEATKDLTGDREGAIKKLLAAFKPLGVNQAMIEDRLGRPLTGITPTELTDLRGVYTAIIEGHTSVSDEFEGFRGPKPASASTQEVQDRLANAAKTSETSTKTAQDASEKPEATITTPQASNAPQAATDVQNTTEQANGKEGPDEIDQAEDEVDEADRAAEDQKMPVEQVRTLIPEAEDAFGFKAGKLKKARADHLGTENLTEAAPDALRAYYSWLYEAVDQAPTLV